MADTFLSDSAVVGTSIVTVYTAPGSLSEILVMELTVSNLLTATIEYEIYIEKTGSSNKVYKAGPNTPLPQGSSDELASGKKIVMKSADTIKALCNTAAGISVGYSLVERG